MQSLQWYAKRLRSMSPAEVRWRIGGKLMDSLDRIMLTRRQSPTSMRHILNGMPVADSLQFGLVTDHLTNQPVAGFDADWRDPLIAEAEAVLNHKISLFDMDPADLGPQIRWNYEYKARKATPMNFAPSVDYRDYSVTGDCKFVWEINRHHFLVILGRAYRVTGDTRFAEKLIEILLDWMRACPFGTGMNWRSPLELGIRLINWAYGLDLIAPSGLISQSIKEEVLRSAHLHLQDISRKYSRFSSANNHLIGEAAGVFIGASFFNGLKNASRWQQESRAILTREILDQTFPDGGGQEQATGYQLFVMQFFTAAGLVARKCGTDFPESYWERLEKMYAFIGSLSDGGNMPLIGDSDDGYVLDLGGTDCIVKSYMGVGAVLFGRPDFKARSGGFSEPAFWLFGLDGKERFECMDDSQVPDRIGCEAFSDSGYYLLQRGRRNGDDRISVLFDCGQLGFKSIAAHGHADALSVVVRLGGVDLLIDPGTYDYFTYPQWRNYFRSTKAHNTVSIDGYDQSQLQGAFLWAGKANAKCLEWGALPEGECVEGEHDGFFRLSDPVVHRRRITLRKGERTIIFADAFDCKHTHNIEQCWHFGVNCSVKQIGDGSLKIDFGLGIADMEWDSPVEIELVRGGSTTHQGWFSDGYHRKYPTTTVVAKRQIDGATSLQTQLRWTTNEGEPGREPI